MSGGLSSLSDDDLMRQLAAARSGGVAPASPPASIQTLSDDDLMQALAASRGRAPGEVSSSRANPFDPGGAATFDERFGSGPMARAPDTSDPMYEGLRARADEQLVGKPSAENAAAAFILRSGNAAGLNLPRNAAAWISSWPAVGNGKSFAQNYELAQEQEAALARQHGRAALAGDVTGIVSGAVALPGLSGAATLKGRALQGAATGLGYGAVSEFADSHDARSAGGAALLGGALGGAAVPAIEKLTPVVSGGAKALWGMVSRGRPVVNEAGELTQTAIGLLRREGVDAETLTPEVRAGIGRAIAAKGESEAALREALAGEFGIPLSRGQATGDLAALSLEDAARAGQRGEKAKTVADEFGRRQSEAITAAGDRFADRAGRGVRLDNPQMATEVIADQAREYAKRLGFEADEAQRAADGALTGLRGGSTLDTLDAADAVRQGVRGAAATSKAGYRQAYDEVAAIPGEFTPGALDKLGTTVRQRLGTDVLVDEVTTPAANRFLRDLDNLPGLFGAEPGTGPTLQQMEQVRKRLSAYSRSAGQNPSDLRALAAIREAFDQHVDDALGAGLFGPRQAAQAAPDGFPGAAALDAPSASASAAGGRPERKESLLQFLGRRGGIALDDDARAADYGRIQTGFGPLGRKNGRPIEDFRDELAAEGFIRPDDDAGMISRKIGDELHDLIGMERRGEPVYRLEDISRSGPRDRSGRLAGESEAAAERSGNLSQQILTELDAVGIRGRDVDPDTLRDATDLLARGRFDDATEAYEAAVMARQPAGSRGASGDVPFDGPTAVAASDALPGAAPDVVQKMRQARALYSSFRRTFGPQGAGDDVGLAMRKIVDREAEPVEVARMLYRGNPGLNMRMADRIKSVVGADSEAWAAHQQGYLADVLNGSGRDLSAKAVSERIGAALTGDRRGLTYRVLTDDQIAGLRQAQTAIRTAQGARDSVPEWITALGRTDFDANRITADLFGSGVPGSRPGSAAYAGALKRFVGEDSAEWSGLRLAAWQKLAMKPDGTEMLPPKQVAARINEFVDGKGKGLARQLFEPELLADLRRYGNAVRQTVRSDGTPLPNDGGTAGKLAGKALDAIATAVGFKVGGFAGAGAAYTARLGSKGIQGGLNARSVRRSFEGGAPALPRPGIATDPYRVGSVSGSLTAGGVE